jgi:hypothetical protein
MQPARDLSGGGFWVEGALAVCFRFRRPWSLRRAHRQRTPGMSSASSARLLQHPGRVLFIASRYPHPHPRPGPASEQLSLPAGFPSGRCRFRGGCDQPQQRFRMSRCTSTAAWTRRAAATGLVVIESWVAAEFARTGHTAGGGRGKKRPSAAPSPNRNATYQVTSEELSVTAELRSESEPKRKGRATAVAQRLEAKMEESDVETTTPATQRDAKDTG